MNQLRIILFVAVLVGCRLALTAAPSADAIKQLAEDYFARRTNQSVHAGLTIDGANVSAKFGARPIWEPDLIVVVKDAGINQAKTTLDVAKHLNEVVAFIELPDRIVAETEKMDGSLITAINTSARLGVLGQRVKIEPTAKLLAALEKMTVTATDQKGAELAKATGDALLGHPLNPVLWLIDDLAATGEKLKTGDLISLGSFARPQIPQSDQTVTVRYDGLPGGPLKASVTFTE